MSKVFLALLPALLVAGSPKAQTPPGFDPQGVVRQVRAHNPVPRPPEPLNPPADDGEFLVDTSIARVPAYEMQWYPSVAFDGTNFLVVWHDWRRDYPNYIYCARVSPAGVVLDPAGIAIAPVREEWVQTAVAFDGANFLAVWEDVGDSSAGDIQGARVSPAGMVLDPGGFHVSASPERQLHPAIAFQSPNFLVVWDDWRDGIRGTRVTPAGVVLDPDGIIIATTSDGIADPDVASDGTNFLVAWVDGRTGDDYDIYGARVSEAGVVLDPDGIRISLDEESQQSPAVAFDGTNYLVVWYGMTDQDLRGSRVSPAGGVLDTNDIAIAPYVDRDHTPAVAFVDTTFLVVWGDYNGGYRVFGARVTRSGVALDSGGFAIGAGAYEASPQVASAGVEFFAVWADDRGLQPYDICGARVSQAGIVLDSNGFVVSTAARQQVTPAAASDSTDFLVVWKEERNGNNSIYGARVDAAGHVLDPEDFAISFSGDTESYPAVASDGVNYLVVWEQFANNGTHDIYGARVSPDGVVLDTPAIVISAVLRNQIRPALAFNGTDFLVAWHDERSTGMSMIYCARVSPDGVVLDPEGIAVAPRHHDYLDGPAVGSDGNDFLITWGDAGIHGARVSSAGNALDSGGFTIANVPEEWHAPSMGFDGSGYFVVWADRRSGADYDVYGARVTTAGVLIDTPGIPVSTAARDQRHPAVEFDGTNFLVLWQDKRNDYAPDLYGAFVNPDGSVSGSGAVVAGPGFQSVPALARGPGGHVLLAYQGWTGTVGGKTYNADRIWGKLDPRPGVAEGRQPTVCSSRPAATIVRGVLEISSQLTAGSLRPEIGLLDAGGRQVMKLKPGDNDVSRLAPGVYFVADQLKRKPQAQAQAVRKVIVTR
jgi:hypothetical protein